MHDFIDHVTVKHGPAQALGSFFVDAHNTALHHGFRLTLEHDMAALLELNGRYRESWLALPTVFDHRYHDLDASNAAWIAARDADGEPVAAVANRLYRWQGTCLRDELHARRMHYARPERDAPALEEWRTTAPAAVDISGDAVYAGALWVHPTHRGTGFNAVMAHLALGLAWTMWDPDHWFSVIYSSAVRRGVTNTIAFKHFQEAITRRKNPQRPDIDTHLTWTSRAEYQEQLDWIETYPAFISRKTETRVATGEPSRRLQGRMIRS